tara:strand:+ start:3006 stop:3155 length:150 start_codon:yes stop_codon:yes gene_type:complete
MKVKLNTHGGLVPISKILNPDQKDGEFRGIAKFNFSFVEYIKKLYIITI